MKKPKNWKWWYAIPLCIMAVLDIVAIVLMGMRVLTGAFLFSVLWLVFGVIAPFAVITTRTIHERGSGRVISRESWNEGMRQVSDTAQAAETTWRSYGPIVLLGRLIKGYILFLLFILACLGAVAIYIRV
jgi:hypothetical protein